MAKVAERVTAASAGRRIVKMVAAILMLQSCSGVAAPKGEGDWLTVTDKSLEILPGSALDFSDLSGDLHGAGPFEIAGDRLAPRARPNAAVNCASLAPGFSVTAGSSFPDASAADRYAEQLRRHGYNIVRFHFLDSLLMQGRSKDFDFDPEQVRRFQYLMKALKSRDIAWTIDLMSSENGADGSVGGDRYSKDLGLKTKLFFEPKALAHWKTLSAALLTTVNPYTGLSPAQDPNTAAVILVNEGSIDFLSYRVRGKNGGGFPPDLLPPYVAWLAKNRPDSPARLPPSQFIWGTEMADFQLFLTERQVETTRDMINHVRKLGYDGPITGFDNWSQVNQIPSRRILPFVDMHGYMSVPPAGRAGQVVPPTSSLEEGAGYLRSMAANRFLGRPLTVTEYDHPFWGSHRFESGLAASAMASLQGWSFICRHADGVIDLAYDGAGVRKGAIYPDGGGLDPVARAAETVTALLMLRREISPAQATIALTTSDAETLGEGGLAEVPAAVSMMAWVARIGLLPDPTAKSMPGVDLVLPLGGPAGSAGMQAAVGRWVESPFQGSQAIVDSLRSRGLLPSSNRTDPSANVWEAPNGQVVLDGRNHQLRVRTSYTEAVATEPPQTPIGLGTTTLNKLSQAGLVAFSSLDGRLLPDSRRILVVLASDARNTGMEVVPETGALIKLGALPVQLLRTRAEVTMMAPKGSTWRFSSLRLNGAIDAGQRLSAPDGRLTFEIDTGMSPVGPTTFFLLERL